MSNRTIAGCGAVAVVAGFAAMIGCTSTPMAPVAPLADCDSQNCRVKVKVTDCTRHDGFLVVPDTLVVDAPKHIHWELVDSAQYKFAALGIDIKKNDGVFETPKEYSNGNKFRWKDRHFDAPGFGANIYNYTINVVHRTGAVTCGAFDPKIANQ